VTTIARSGAARSNTTRSALLLGSSSSPGTGTTLRGLIAIVRDRLLETLSLITPGAPLVSPQRATGLISYSYAIVALNAKGHTEASEASATTTGVDPLSTAAYNRITWTPVVRATSYQIYRTMGGLTTGLIGTSTAPLFDDKGAVGDGTLPPTTNTSGVVGVFWSDDELLRIMILGAKDLWRAFIDLHQENFFTANDTDVTLPAGSATLLGIPKNVHRILTIAPRPSLDGTGRAIRFAPSKYTKPEFLQAATLAAVRPDQGSTILYAVTGAGAPTGAPTVYVAPSISVDLPILLVYIPTLSGALTFGDTNPVPGESDAALIAYTVAYALAKQRDDNSPDPNWLAVYSTEKNSCLVASAPRQEQTAPVVTGIFDDLTGPGLSGDDWDD
jgi:hypothetical protein